jgi:endonuclease III
MRKKGFIHPSAFILHPFFVGGSVSIMSRIPLPQVIDRLGAFYGEPDPPEVTDPWEMIVWENVAYLVTDEHRREAMTTLRERIGISPEEIMAAPAGQLLEAAVRGIVPDQSVEKLRRSAEIALHEFGGDLRPILKRPLAQAKKALKRFPAIGDPGAEKILLFCRAFPILALDSNGLRVLVRLGFGEEKPNYSVTYRLVQKAIEEEVIKEYPWLIKAHQLLRRHGEELCRRSRPHCAECALLKECPWPTANLGN